MTQPNTVTVHILDKEYCIACPADERASTESAARYGRQDARDSLRRQSHRCRPHRRDGRTEHHPRPAAQAAAPDQKPTPPAPRCVTCWSASTVPWPPIRMVNCSDARAARWGILPTSSLECWPVGDVPEPIRTTTGVASGAGVHVRLTESLNASCNLHLELSGSRANPTAARPGSPDSHA